VRDKERKGQNLLATEAQQHKRSAILKSLTVVHVAPRSESPTVINIVGATGAREISGVAKRRVKKGE
jgi:hypothetical protein